jgi:predicted O-methyltransferase YrrM
VGEALWVDVDRYLDDVLVKQDAVLKAALTSSDAAELPAISVSPNQGKLLHIIARSISARAILEIGTLGGYSTIWLARALPADGKLITLEANEKHAAVARANLAQAGLSERVDVRVGRALESLPKIAADGDGPFDLVFIDADKQTNPDYFEWALTLSRPGTLILVDNVVRDGKLIEASSRDPDILGVRRLLNAMANDRRVVASAMQTVGVKGYDGFAMALVVET